MPLKEELPMPIALPIEKQAGMAQIRKMIRVKAQINTGKMEVDDGITMYPIFGRLWLDLGSVAAEPFRFKAVVESGSSGLHESLTVTNFRPAQGALSGAAEGLATFYESALGELIQENPRLIKG
jgi:hypothetical protein